MSALKPITIVGGGLAGLTLGIGLRRREIPVTIWEAGIYPRHRVCGEFISGRGQEVLRQLELEKLFREAGSVTASTVAFFSNGLESSARKMPEPALCLTRFAMDELLAKEFQRLGGGLHLAKRWSANANDTNGIVHAGGRRLQTTEGGWRWFGLKVHARGVVIKADLEMHVATDRYVGIGITSGGMFNVCGLFRRRAGESFSPAAGLDILRGPPGTLLRERLANATFDEKSFCSVAGLMLRPQRASSRKDCCLGDAITMIPPVTGNGMSMAFESAALAIEPLANFSRGNISWPTAQQTIARACDQAFSNRLRWASWLQWLMFAVAPRPLLGSMAIKSDWLWRAMVARTR